MTGVALAFELLAQELGNYGIDAKIVDSIRGQAVKRSGTFSIKRGVDTLLVVGDTWRHLLSSEVLYSTMSTSTVGFIRDYLVVGFAKLLGRRTVMHLHGGGFEEFYRSQGRFIKRFVRKNLARTDTIIVLGDLLKPQFYCAGDFVKDKLEVVPNGLTLGIEEPPRSIKELREGRRVELLYLSSLMPSKGFFAVLQSMISLEAICPGRFHLNLCGGFVDARTESTVDVFDEESLKSFVRDNRLEACVTYHGPVIGEAKEQLFKEATVFLLPTSYPWEGQPLSIIEALAFSTPIISCHHKGIPELVEDGETGLFVESGSVKSIVNGIVRLTEDPVKYSEMSRKAREHYEQNFRRDVHLDRLIPVILGESKEVK